MPKNAWRQEIAPNVPVILDGVSYVIDTVSEAWVTVRDTVGCVTSMPIRRLARLIARDDAPPPLSDKLESLEQRASPKQAAKVAERKAIVRWFETGLRPEQADGDRPDPWHDPTRVTGRVARINAIAEVLAKRRGTHVESTKKLVRTILEKATNGDAGLYDPRMLTDDLGTLPQRIEPSVRRFLTDAAFQSTVTDQAMFEAYCGWARREIDEIVPTQRTFERALTMVYARYPHLRRNAKSRASAAEGPKVSLQRRQPERIGELWLIDATPANVMIRDPYADVSKRREVRVDHTKIMEACSRYIVGRSIAEEVNGYAAGLAIADAFHRMTDEHDAVVFEGRTFPRPFVGLPRVISRWPIPPRRLLTDNGREFLNKYGMFTLHRLGIDVEPARVKDGRGKGRLERHFGSQKTGYEQQQRNYIGSAVSERGRDSTKELVLTWRELVDRDQQWTDLHNVEEHEGLYADTHRQLSPTERWIELAEEHGITEMPAWRNEWIRFLPNMVLRLTQYGVTRRKLVYNAPIIRFLIEVDGAAPSGKVRIFWNPADLRQVYCFDPEGNAYVVPWVHRTEDTVAFGDFDLDWANARLEGGTYSKKQAQALRIDMITQWQAEDKILLANLHGKRNAEEILVSQLTAIQRGDLGTIVGAEQFLGAEFVDDVLAAGEELVFDDAGLDLLPNVDAVDVDLFDRFG